MPLPRFRSLLKVASLKYEGKDVFMVADPQEGLFDHQVALPPLAFVVAAFLDGRRDAAEVQRAIEENLQGVKIGIREIEDVVRDLDQHYLLETERLRERRRRVEREFIEAPQRPLRFVRGGASEVSRELDGYFESPEGAGRPVNRGAGDGLAAIMAPHIDLRRGGHCYTYAYREVAERSDAEVYVVLGVAHLSPPTPFVVTRRNYETPFGAVETDRAIVDTLAGCVGDRLFEHEALHRSEHSVEFQAVFLKHVRPDIPFTLVPILCSSFEPFCGEASPSTVPSIEEFLGALAEAVRGRKICWVVAVDLAHVGPVFGDDVKIDAALVEWMVRGDNESLRACQEGNAEGFWNSVMAGGNPRHVCGVSAIYAGLRLLDGASGRLLKYGFAPDSAGGLVSFASMTFEPRSRIIVP